MNNKRPDIPESIKRSVLIEAGHRCAIPTCRQVPVEIAHIIPWADSLNHSFENLIALCPTCHTSYDRGDIDRISIKIYKQNLSVVNSRYGDLERRIIEIFSVNPSHDKIWLIGGLDILLMYLLQDGLLIRTNEDSGVVIAGMPSQVMYQLTPHGRVFVNNWRTGKVIV